MIAGQFFPEPVPELREELQAYLDWLRKDAANITGLRAFLLAGGYGRGEGGVWYGDGSSPPRLYNDMEFYVFAPAVQPAQLHHWIEEGESRFGIEMEFKVMHPDAFARARPSMFYYDLLASHVMVAGSAEWLRSLPVDLANASMIPFDEGSRLLVNRAMSLLRCRRWAAGALELEPDFCDRIIAKIQLALGDAVLCINQSYHWSCEERGARLAKTSLVPPEWDSLQTLHAQGRAFKFRPSCSMRNTEEWRMKLAGISTLWLSTFLWVEGQRLGQTFDQALDYVNRPQAIFAGESRWKNRYRQLRDLRRRPRLPYARGDHPRALVWRALVALLAGETAAAERCLGISGASATVVEERCREAWKLYP